MQQFPIIYCDPPWWYADRREEHGGAAVNYNVATLETMIGWQEQFLAMRPPAGVMLMWVTGPYAEDAPKLMRAWGYTPVKPIFYWVKTTSHGRIYYGPGAYTGSNVEYILLGHANPNRILKPVNRVKQGGDGEGVHEVQMLPHPKDGKGKIIHSSKPDLFRDLAVKLFGNVPRVEVFARERVAGWHAIGDQLPGGEAIGAGKVVTPLAPPTGHEAGIIKRGGFVQQPLFGVPS